MCSMRLRGWEGASDYEIVWSHIGEKSQSGNCELEKLRPLVEVGYTEKLGEMGLMLVVGKRKAHIFLTGASLEGDTETLYSGTKGQRSHQSTQTLWNCLESCCEKKVLPSFSFRELPGQFMIFGSRILPRTTD